MPYQINIDTREITKLTEALRGLHRSSFPNAVRTTLNDLAFDTKQNQLTPTARQVFTVRNENLFRKFSKVEKATGFNVGSMSADTGMLNKGAGQTFDEQEEGGTYVHKNIPLTTARVGNARSAKIGKQNYRNDLNILDRGKKTKNRSRRSQFVADAAKAFELNKLMMHNKFIFRVLKFKQDEYGIRIKLKPLYKVEDGQAVKVKPVHFVEKSAMKSIKKADKFYRRAVNHEFKKHFK